MRSFAKKSLPVSFLVVPAAAALLLTAQACDDAASASSGNGAGTAAAADSDKPDVGLWMKLKSTSTDPAADAQALRDVASIPYAGSTDITPKDADVRYINAELIYNGVNLVVSGHGPEAILMDMKANKRASWSCDPDVVLEGVTGFEPGYETFWRRAHVYPNGDLLAIFDGISMIKLDVDSNVLWTSHGNYHHDMHVDQNGDIYTLSRHARTEHPRFEIEKDASIEEDFICILGPDGVEKQRVSVLDAFLDSDYSSALTEANHKGDVLHVNTIELMDGRFADRHPMFAKGNVLISTPTVNYIAVVSLEAKKVVWALGGKFRFQHEPTVLDNGNILVFDNGGIKGPSKAMEIDPITQEVVWTFPKEPTPAFHSHFLGSCARLPNGNTLITESTKGKALEVTQKGEVCWEYINPKTTDDKKYIAVLFEVVRYSFDYFDDEFGAELRPPEAAPKSSEPSAAQKMLDRMKKKGGPRDGENGNR